MADTQQNLVAASRTRARFAPPCSVNQSASARGLLRTLVGGGVGLPQELEGQGDGPAGLVRQSGDEVDDLLASSPFGLDVTDVASPCTLPPHIELVYGDGATRTVLELVPDVFVRRHGGKCVCREEDPCFPVPQLVEPEHRLAVLGDHGRACSVPGSMLGLGTRGTPYIGKGPPLSTTGSCMSFGGNTSCVVGLFTLLAARGDGSVPSSEVLADSDTGRAGQPAWGVLSQLA